MTSTRFRRSTGAARRAARGERQASLRAARLSGRPAARRAAVPPARTGHRHERDLARSRTRRPASSATRSCPTWTARGALARQLEVMSRLANTSPSRQRHHRTGCRATGPGWNRARTAEGFLRAGRRRWSGSCASECRPTSGLGSRSRSSRPTCRCAWRMLRADVTRRRDDLAAARSTVMPRTRRTGSAAGSASRSGARSTRCPGTRAA